MNTYAEKVEGFQKRPRDKSMRADVSSLSSSTCTPCRRSTILSCHTEQLPHISENPKDDQSQAHPIVIPSLFWTPRIMHDTVREESTFYVTRTIVEPRTRFHLLRFKWKTAQRLLISSGRNIIDSILNLFSFLCSPTGRTTDDDRSTKAVSINSHQSENASIELDYMDDTVPNYPLEFNNSVIMVSTVSSVNREDDRNISRRRNSHIIQDIPSLHTFCLPPLSDYQNSLMSRCTSPSIRLSYSGSRCRDSARWSDISTQADLRWSLQSGLRLTDSFLQPEFSYDNIYETYLNGTEAVNGEVEHDEEKDGYESDKELNPTIETSTCACSLEEFGT